MVQTICLRANFTQFKKSVIFQNFLTVENEVLKFLISIYTISTHCIRLQQHTAIFANELLARKVAVVSLRIRLQSYSSSSYSRTFRNHFIAPSLSRFGSEDCVDVIRCTDQKTLSKITALYNEALYLKSCFKYQIYVELFCAESLRSCNDTYSRQVLSSSVERRDFT